LEVLGVLERRLLLLAEDLLLRRLPRLGAFGVRDRRARLCLFLVLERGSTARRFELLGVRARRLLLFERRRDREVEALAEAERDRLRLGAFGVLARRAERRRLELDRRDAEADREDERRLDPFGEVARRLRFFGVRALREELRRAFLTFCESPL